MHEKNKRSMNLISLFFLVFLTDSGIKWERIDFIDYLVLAITKSWILAFKYDRIPHWCTGWFHLFRNQSWYEEII